MRVSAARRTMASGWPVSSSRRTRAAAGLPAAASAVASQKARTCGPDDRISAVRTRSVAATRPPYARAQT